MPQAITYQRGTNTITVALNATGNIDPTVLATAPSTGVSRVIITQLTFRCLDSNSIPTNAIFLLSLGSASTGYGYIGGADVANTSCGFLGFNQVLGTSHAGSGNGGSGSCVFFTQQNCNTDPSGSTITNKQIAPEKIQLTAPGTQVAATLSNQIWALPGEQIGIKIGASSFGVTYEVVYSFIFITES